MNIEERSPYKTKKSTNNTQHLAANGGVPAAAVDLAYDTGDFGNVVGNNAASTPRRSNTVAGSTSNTITPR